MLIGIFFMMCFIAILIISIGTSIIRGILNLFLGLFGRTSRPFSQASQSDHSSQQAQTNHQTGAPRRKKKEKIFDKTDGEYIDFIEIKE